MLEYLTSGGVATRQELPYIAHAMGILERSKDGVTISENGRALSDIREEARGDILHFLMYAGWDAEDPMTFPQSWGYRNCCDRYWAAHEVQLTSPYLDRQVEETIDEAYRTFEALNVPEFDEVAFSRKSLTGAHKWMLALDPPVLHPNSPDAKDRVFRRRDFCQPELAVLALAWALRNESTVTGVDILLTTEKREAISKVCLLSPESLDQVLDWAIPTFPELISAGTSAGFYGRFVRLKRLPSLQDLAR